MKNPLVLICPAYNTTPEENWYFWLRDNLNQLGYEAKVLEFPTPHAPHEKEWVETIKAAHKSDPLILVGHSLGCRAILAYLNQYEQIVKQIVLVATPIFWEGIIETRPPLHEYVQGMQKLEYTKLRKLVKRADIFHDELDDLVPMKNYENLLEDFGDEAIGHVCNKYGHFDVKEIPELMEIFPNRK